MSGRSIWLRWVSVRFDIAPPRPAVGGRLHPDLGRGCELGHEYDLSHGVKVAAYSRPGMAQAGEKGAKDGARTLAEAARAARARASSAEPKTSARRRGGAMDVFGGEIRRRDVFPLLVLHLISREPAYGNLLIEEIETITDGMISVNPNTIYPLLRDLESRGR